MHESVKPVWCRCNNAAEFIAVSPEGYGHVQCVVCGMRTGGKVAEHVAIADWNAAMNGPDRRPPQNAKPMAAGPKERKDFTREQLAKMAFAVFYSGNLCAPQNIAAVVKEIDCCPGCDHVSSGGSTCYKFEATFGPDSLPALATPPLAIEALREALTDAAVNGGAVELPDDGLPVIRANVFWDGVAAGRRAARDAIDEALKSLGDRDGR